MKNILTCLCTVLLASFSYGQNFFEELKNSVERAKGGSGAEVVYQVYVTPSNLKAYKGSEFDSGTLVGEEGNEKYFELVKRKEEEKEVVVINLKSTTYMELEVELDKGHYKYTYKFYY